MRAQPPRGVTPRPEEMRAACGACEVAAARIYCPADDANLCMRCDRTVRDDATTTRRRDDATAGRRGSEETRAGGHFFERRARDVLEDGRASFEAVNRARIIFIARSSRSWGRGDANARGRGR